MAEFTVNHKIISEVGAKTSGSSRPVGKSNDTAIVRGISKALEKTLKSLSNTLSKKIADDLGKTLVSHLRRSGTTSSKIDIKTEAKNLSKQVAKDISNSLVNTLSKQYIGGRSSTPNDPSKAMNSFMRNLDKHIEAGLGKINTSLQTKTGGKVQLDPASTKDLSKTLANIIGNTISKAIPKETGTTVRELGSISKTLASAVKEIRELVKSIQGMKKSGGGIDVSEIPKVVENFRKLSIEASKLPSDFNKLRESTKKLVGEQKQILEETNKAISNAKKEISSTVRIAKESPTKFLPSANVAKKEASEIITQIKNELGKTVKKLSVDVEIKGFENNKIKQLESVATKLDKTFDKAEKTAAKFDNAADKISKTPQLPSNLPTKKTQTPVTTTISKDFYKSLDALDKRFGEIVKKWGNDLATEADKFAVSDSTAKTIEDLSSFLDQFRKAFKSADIPVLKEVTAKTIATGKPVIGSDTERLLGEFRKILIKMSDTSSAAPVDLKKDFSDSMESIGKKIESGVKDGIKEGFKESQPQFARSPGQIEQIKNIQKVTSQIRGPFRTSQYPQIAIPPTTKDVTLDMPGAYGKEGTKVRQAVQQRISGLASSLKSLQDSMVTILDKEFKEAGKGWEVVKDSTQQNVQDFFKIVTSGNLKTAGKQFAFDVANVSGIKRELTKRGVTTKVTSSTAAVKELKAALIDESVQKARGEFLEKIAQWIKTKTKEEISVWEGLGDVKGRLTEVKELDVKSKGVLPGKEIVKSLKARLNKQQIEEVFKKTFASVEAERFMKQPGTDSATGGRRSPLVRTVSIPAARLTKTGATVFETARGSQRALPQFAVFKTGFERIYSLLEKQQSLVYDKGFAEKIQKVGVRPTGPDLKKANELAKEMLKDFAGAGVGNVEEIRKHLQKASKIKATELAPKAKLDFGKKIESALKIDELSSNMDSFIKAIEEAGLSAFDIVKAMDKLEFQNIYDILQKVLTTGLEPLQALGKSPQFDKTIRDLETAIQQTVQTLPLIEPGRPRRALHQENVLNLLSRTTGPFVGEKPLAPEKQTEFIKDLNIRFNEMIRDAGATGEQILKKGMRTVSTLGIPEAQASKVQFFRPGTTAPSEKFLSALDAVSTKMYTDILPEMAPFGSQFTQFGRNIANVTNALTSSKNEIDKFTKGFGATAVEGFGTEFPALRTQRESSLIAGGRLGSTGYGFNVMTELRHTAGTFEDQILVSGKMAEALTSIVKNIVKPSAGGRLLRGDVAGAESIEDIREGVVSDVAINKVFQEFQKVLGVPQKYQGQADRAFLDEVKKSITVVRGEEVEVQQARLTEVFLNFFGRKLTTRYGSKGVSVTPKGLDESIGADIAKAIQAFPKAKVKVLTEEERGKAGLGVALLPKSMGELLSEVIGKYEDQLIAKDFDVAKLQDSLLQSGNKFILDLFKTTGVVTAEEALEQSKLYEEIVSALDALGFNIKKDLEGIKSIRGLFKAEIGEEAPMFKEKPIDVRISSYGIGKRGLQPEFLESIMSNIAGTGPRGVTTLATKTPTKGKFGYPELLGTAGQKGLLSTISGELGFETIGKREDIEQMLFERFKISGKDPDTAKIMAKRGAALEALSNYYTTIIDETGKMQKSIVGEKFVSIVEEPGQFAPTTASDIRRKESGVKIDVPVFAAYSTVFGESSKMMEEIGKGSTFAAKKHWEFIKALQFTNDQAKDLQTRLSDYLEEVDLLAVKSFDQATGILAEQGDKLDPKSLADTIFDVKKFPKPFLLQIPKATGKAGEKEPFYVPSPIARGTFAEELIAGERGFDVLARRIQHVINMAKEADELLQRPAELQSEIEKLEAEMSNLVMTGKSAESQDVGRVLESKKTDLDRILSGSGAFSTTVKAKVLDKITELVKKSRQSTNVDEVKEILNTLASSLSTFEAPAEAFRVKGIGAAEISAGVRQITPVSSELENLGAFLEKEIKVKGTAQIQAYKKTIGKAFDMLVGQSPQAQTFFDKVVKGISEIKTGQTPESSDLLKELQGSLAQEKRFRGKPLLQSLEEKKRLTEPVITATRSRQTTIDRAIQKGEGAAVAAKLGVDIEQDLQAQYFKKLDNLQKAKIDYYNELARATVGKEGAVVSTLFSKTIPGLMQKAITATVDRTDELNEFKENLRKIFEATDPSLIDLSGLAGVTQDISKIASEHSKRVTQQKRAGLPVLKQHEVGIPMRAAKKLPAEFIKKFAIIPPSERGEEGRIERFAKPVKKKGTLFDLLSYIEDLQEVTETGKFSGKPIDIGELGQKIQDHIEKDLFPYVEAIRYPFTGVSSIVPYEAKLLTGRLGKEGEKTFAVPGAPDMDIAGFNKIINELRAVVETAGEMREAEFKRADITGTTADMAKIAEFGSLIDQLSQVISEAIPKYAAHTAKLDFDGDQIVLHTAKTKEAREEIKRHHDTIVNFNSQLEKGVPFGKTTQGTYRDIFTSEALLSQQPTGPAILAESAEAFYKKFPKEKGFEFLKKPFLTEEMEFLKPPEKLSTLAMAGQSITNMLEDIIEETIKGAEHVPEGVGKLDKDLVLDAIKLVQSPFETIEKEIENISTGDFGQRIDFAGDILEAIRKLDAELGSKFTEEIEKVMTSKLFEERYKDAITAQLFKIQTGIEVESLYRINRIAESDIGFGGGFIGKGGFKSSEQFRRKHPADLGIVGKQPELESQTLINELVRFGIQKGMDVKHAGERPVAGEMVKHLTKGPKGAADLWKKITDDTKSDKSYDELADFQKANEKAIRLRTGALPTEQIRTELKSLYEARGTKFDAGKLAGADREQLQQAVVDAVGLKNFLEDLALQIQTAAIEGTIKELKKTPPAKRPKGAGDVEAYARKTVAAEMATEGINVRKRIAMPSLPLYSFRREPDISKQLALSEKTRGEIPVSGFEFRTKKPAEVKALMTSYREARATTMNLQEELQEVIKGSSGEAAAQMMRGSIELMHAEQSEIEAIVKKLKAEGFDASSINRNIRNLKERLLTGTDIPKITADILKTSSKARLPKMEKLAEFAGLPTMGKEEKFEIGRELLSEFHVEGLKRGKAGGLEADALEEAAEKFANRMVEKAEVLFEMDRILDALVTKAQEGRFLVSLLPKKSAAKQIRPTAATSTEQAQSFAFEKRMQEIGLAREPGASGIGNIPPRAGGPGIGGPGGFGELYKGGVVPVHIVSVAKDLAIGFGGPTAKEDEIIKSGREAKAKVEEFKRIIKSGREEDDVDYSKVYRASGLAAGGEYSQRSTSFGKAAKPGARGISQVESIMKSMLALNEFDERLEAAADVGTALHLKIQEALKQKLGIGVDIEKFVSFGDEVSKSISGHIDAVIRDASGKAKDVIDIKTVGQHFVDSLGRLADASGTVDFESVKESGKMAVNVRQKLENVASQLNLYVAALKQMGEASEDISAEAQFFSVDDKALDKPIKVKFKFDPDRLTKDLEAITTARELINEFVLSNKPLEEAAEEYRDVIQRIKKTSTKKGVTGFATAKSPEALLKESLEPVLELTSEQIDEFVKASLKVYKATSAQPGISREPGRPRNIDPAAYKAGRKFKITPDERVIPKYREDFAEPLQAQFANLRELHKQTVAFQQQYNKLGLNTMLSEMHTDIQSALSERTPPMTGGKFNEVISALKEAEDISYADFIKAWKLWRITMGDFLSNQAKQAEDAFSVAKESGTATQEFAEFSDSVEKFREFVIRSAGKQTDIYTQNRRFIFGDLAKEAGAFLNPEQLVEKSRGVFGEDDQTRAIFESIVKGLESGGSLAAPTDVVRGMVKELSGVDQELLKMMENAELVKRMGAEMVQTWDFERITKGAIRLREALAQYSKFNLSEAIDVEARTNIKNIISMLAQVEKLYGKLDLAKTAEGPFGKYEAGLIKVPQFLPPSEQEALHLGNIQRVRERFAKPEEEGGAEIGEKFTYFMKVADQAGNSIKNIGIQFNKYGEAALASGEKVGRFSEINVDLGNKLRTTSSMFKSALKRVVMWGGAATLVYGGVQKLKDSVGELADIELGIAQLRMVMNPLETNFEQLTKSAVNFAKQYGVGVNDVIRAMKIFAQQGLKQSEVVSRAQVSTLAANVTTLAAAEATEALTAAMKSFGPEIGTAMTALDSWSEVEAKHAITAGDMANAIKKSAAAARNAGFTFNELNGVVASIGAVTRQSGKEVGTAMRFIFRRLTAEKGPKVLAEIGIPTITDSGELRRGFDVLSDLSDQWDDLTSAQKMNIAQAIGGTRQYNAVLVLMDNWNEALSAIEHSTNSKGSAERRNLEIMKTYAKQLEQTKAAATELKMEFGKFVFPAFKMGLTGLKTMFEIMSAIPAPVKAAGVALTMFFAYAAKGVGVFDTLFNTLDRGQSAIANFYDEFKKQGDISLFEVFGRKQPSLDVRGLKTMALGVEGATKGTEFKDFHSGIGKLTFLLKNVGDSYNEFLGNLAGPALSATGTAGEAIESLSDKLQNLGVLLQGGALLTPGFLDDLVMGFINVSSVGTEGFGELLQFIESKFGPKAKKFAADAAAHNTGLVKSLLPLGLTAVAVAKSFDSLYGGYVRMGKSAQDYAKHVYNLKRMQETELQGIRDLMGSYKMLEQRLSDVNKVIQDPGLKEKRQSYDTYVDPLLSLSKIQSDAISTTNRLAEANLSLVAGYDKFGNAVLKTSVNLQTYFKTLEKSKLMGIARTDIDVATKFVEDLTTTEGPEKWKHELKSLLKEAPLVGGLLAKGIKVAPAKALDVITSKINNLVALRNKYPLTSVFDEDIKEYQASLKDIRRDFNETYSDFRKTLSGISTKGLDVKSITDLFKTPGLQKGYELMIEVEPEIKLVNLQRIKADVQKIKPEDILGAEVLKRVKPGVSSYFDVSAELTKARLETAGIAARDTSKVMSGDIVTLIPQIAEQFHVAGNQAIVQLKETTDGVYEWVATYFNTKTMEIEERPFDENIQKMVDRIFPVRRIQEDLAERIDALNEFVAGASAGLRGIGKADFKKDFSLGERYFADIPTTTILQGSKGFTPSQGFGKSPFQQDWSKTIEEFFFKPMRKYKDKLGQLSKLQLTGLEEVSDITLSKDLYEELINLQNVLKNNQVVLQYRAVFVDLTKTIESGTRALKENLAVERSRQELDKPVTGFMEGIARGLDNLEIGARSFADLTVKQRALMESPEYRRTAGRLSEVNIRREGQMENIFAADKVKATLDSIRDVAKGFGASLSPEEMKKYVETVARTGDMGTAELKIETAKVASNTAMTVQKLDDILANMGDSAALGGQLGDIMQDLSAGAFDDSTMKTIRAMNKTARIRDRALKENDTKLLSASNTALDKLVKTLIDNIGFKRAVKQIEGREASPLLSQRLSSGEFKQRAFAGLDFKVFIEKMSKYGERPTTTGQRISQVLTSGLVRKAITGTAGVKKVPPFSESKELQQLRKLQEDANKKSFVDSKSLVKAATAFAVFEQFNKKHSSKTLASLESQAKELENQVTATKAYSATADTSNLEKGLKSVRKAIEKEKESLEFHKMAQAVTIISGGALQFGRAVGLSESAVKKLGAGAIATYGAWKLVAKVTGKEMPDAAKEFGDTLKEAVSEYKEKGKVGLPTGLKVRAAGKKFEETYGERVKEFTGLSKEKFEKEVESKFGKKDISDDDIQKEAEKIRQIAKGSADINRLQQLVLATLAATFAGYANQKLQPQVRTSTLENQAKEQAELIEKVIKTYPEAAEKIIKQMRKDVAAADVKPVKLDTEIKSLVLDTDEEYTKVLQDTSKFRDGLVSEYQIIADETKKLQDSLHEIELVKGLEKQIDDINRGFLDRMQRFQISRTYGGPATLNKQLRGFPGEVELPMDPADMSTQQRAFTDFSKKFKDSVAVYSFSLQEMSTLQEDYGNLLAQRRQFIEDDIDDTEAWDKLEDQINDTWGALEDMTIALRRVGEPLSNLFKFTEAIYKLNDALAEVAIIDATESIRGFKEFQRNLDEMLGGRLPGARVEVSPELEREAAGVGVRLTHLQSTRRDVDEAKLLIRLRTAEGENRRQIIQELADLPERFRREEQTGEQQTYDQRLTRQLEPYRQAVSDLERLRQQPGLPEDRREELRETQELMLQTINRATERVPGQQLLEETRGGFWSRLLGTNREDEKRIEAAMVGRDPDALMYRGVSVKKAKGLDEQFKSIRDQLLEEVPTAEMDTMRLSVTKPLLAELSKHTMLLSLIAKEGYDVDIKELDEDVRTRFASVYRSAEKAGPAGIGDGGGIFGQFKKELSEIKDDLNVVLSPLRMLLKLFSMAGVSPEKQFREMVGFKQGPSFYNAAGGRIFGAGGPTEDKIPAMLSHGEYVIKAASSKKLGYNALNYMNEEGKLPGFAEGGMVQNWLKTAYDFYFGKKDVPMEEYPETMGRMSYLSNKETKRKRLDEAQGFAQGGLPVGAGRPISTITGKPVPTDEERWLGGKKFLSALLDVIPGAGDIKSGQEAWTGEDILREEKLGTLSRVGAGLAALPFVPGILKNIGKIGRKGVSSPLAKKSMTVLGDEITELVNLYPDVSRKLDTIKIRQPDLMGRSRGVIRKSPSQAARLGADKPFEMALAQKLLDDPIQMAKTFKHEKWHAIDFFIRDKIHDPRFFGESEETLNKFLEMRKFIDSFETREPFSRYAERIATDKYFMSLKKHGDPDYASFKPLTSAKYSTENFADFARKVEMGEIKGGLAQQFQELFDPKLFQLGEKSAVAKIPKFKTTGDAAKFGVKATKTEIEELKKLRKQTTLEGATLQEAGKLQESMDVGYKAQLYNEAIQASEGRKFVKYNPKSIRAGFAEGGMVQNWLKTAYDFYFGKKDVPMEEYPETMGRMSYLSNKETKRKMLDEAFDKNSFAEGGMVSNWLKTALDFYFGKKDVMMEDRPETMGRMSYLSNKETKKRMLDEALKIKGFAGGGPIIGPDFEEEDLQFMLNRGYAAPGGIGIAGRGRSAPGILAEQTIKGPMARQMKAAKDEIRRRESIGSKYIGKQVIKKQPIEDQRDSVYRVFGEHYGDVLRKGLTETAGDADAITKVLYGDAEKEKVFDAKRQLAFQNILGPAGMDADLYIGTGPAKLQRKYNKLQYLIKNDPSLIKETVDRYKLADKIKRDDVSLEKYINDNLDIRYQNLFDKDPSKAKEVVLKKLGEQDLLKQGHEAANLLTKIQTGKRLDKTEALSASKFLKNTDIDVRFAKVRGDVEKTKYGLTTDPRVAFLRNPDLFNSYKEALKTGDEGEIGLLKERINTGKTSIDSLVAKFKSANTDKAKEDSRLFFEKFRSVSEFSPEDLKKLLKSFPFLVAPKPTMKVTPTGTAADEVERKAREGAEKFSFIDYFKRVMGFNESLPVKHHGGMITKTGPVFAEKGEFIIPKGFADGGFVDDTPSSAILREGVTQSQDNGIADRIAEKIKEAIESTTVSVDEDAKVSVDVGDVKVPVDTNDAKVELDTTTAAQTLSDAVRSAIDSASIDVKTSGTNSVGADKIDELSTTIRDVQDKIFTINDELSIKIDSLEEQTIDVTVVRGEVNRSVAEAIARVEADIDKQRNDISSVTSSISRMDQSNQYRFDEVTRKANEALNFGARPGM